MNITEARSFALIDQEFSDHTLPAATYEMIRQVIQATGDLGYFNQLQISSQTLLAGAAALAVRIPVVVDLPIVRAGIEKKIYHSFANPLFCAAETITRPQKMKSEVAWGMETLAHRYPEAIFIVGADPLALLSILQLAAKDEIAPALVMGTPAGFMGADSVKERLHQAPFPSITVSGRRGGATVSVTLCNALINLAWKAHLVRPN